MTNKGFVKTRNGAIIYLRRGTTRNANLSSTEWLPETVFKIGMLNGTPSINNNDLVLPIPIGPGIVNDNGANVLTGSLGGNNSTNNTLIFKPGAHTIDNTAQNLVVNTSNVIKRWHRTIGIAITRTMFCGLWLFFKGNSLSVINNIVIKLGSSSSNFFSRTFNQTSLTSGWNWLFLGRVENLAVTGTIGATINYFEIQITTNNATDNWNPDDVIYDLLRTYTYTDTIKSYVSTYPQVNNSALEVTKMAYLTTLDAVGFNINSYADFNEDTSPKMGTEATIITRSKSNSDEVIYTVKERIIL